MKPSSSKQISSCSKLDLQKIFHFFVSVFGKKTKKTFSSTISNLLEVYEKEGLVSFEEKQMFKNISAFGDKRVFSIMTPRADLIAINHQASLEDIKAIIIKDGHTRIPVFKDNLDEIIGFIHSKDLAKFLCKNDEDFSVAKILRKILFVPGSMKLMEVLRRMRISRVHLAIVLDEFGGVDGFVTIEDLMEEIVGEIEDEHDLPLDNSFFRIKKIKDNIFQFGGRVEMSNVKNVLKKDIANEYSDVQTIGGLVMALFRRVPENGEELETEGLKIKIIEADKRVVKIVEIRII